MSPRPSYAQLVKLVEFLEREPGLASGRLRTAAAKAETKRKWMMVAPSINNIGEALKDGAGWAKYWAEKKCFLKRICSERHPSGRGLFNLSELDRRMLDAMGGPKAIGDSNAEDNMPDAFPDSPTMLGSPDAAASSGSCESPPLVIVEENEYRERSPVRPPQTSHVQNSSKVGTRRRSTKKKGVFVSVEEFSELVASVDKLASAQETMSNALTLLAEAFIDLSKKLPSPKPLN